MTPPSVGSSDLPQTPSPSDRGPVHVVATEAGVSTRLWIDGSLVATANGIEFNVALTDAVRDLQIYTRNAATIGVTQGVAGVLANAAPGMTFDFEILDDGLGGLSFTMTESGNPANTATTIYGVYFSTDLTGWGADVSNSFPADRGKSTTYIFDHPAPGAPQIFFRVQQN